MRLARLPYWLAPRLAAAGPPEICPGFSGGKQKFGSPRGEYRVKLESVGREHPLLYIEGSMEEIDWGEVGVLVHKILYILCCMYFENYLIESADFSTKLQSQPAAVAPNIAWSIRDGPRRRASNGRGPLRRRAVDAAPRRRIGGPLPDRAAAAGVDRGTLCPRHPPLRNTAHRLRINTAARTGTPTQLAC